jgi:hypothetical protein
MKGEEPETRRFLIVILNRMSRPAANTKLFELSTQVAEASRKLTLLFKLLQGHAMPTALSSAAAAELASLLAAASADGCVLPLFLLLLLLLLRPCRCSSSVFTACEVASSRSSCVDCSSCCNEGRSFDRASAPTKPVPPVPASAAAPISSPSIENSPIPTCIAGLT